MQIKNGIHNMAKNYKQIKSSKEFEEIINYIRAKHILAGKKPPSIPIITKKIAKKINKEELLHNEFIKF